MKRKLFESTAAGILRYKFSTDLSMQRILGHNLLSRCWGKADMELRMTRRQKMPSAWWMFLSTRENNRDFEAAQEMTATSSSACCSVLRCTLSTGILAAGTASPVVSPPRQQCLPSTEIESGVLIDPICPGSFVVCASWHRQSRRLLGSTTPSAI